MFFLQKSELIDIFVQNYNEPQKLCTEINHFICNCCGIPFSTIKFNFSTSENKNWGSCIPQKNIIHITIDEDNNPFKLCHTIIHETIHLFTTFLIKHNIHSYNIDDLNQQKYRSKIKSYFKIADYSKTEYKHFKETTKSLDFTSNFLNLLLIDKISDHYNFNEQPYAYNLDSNEMISETIAQETVFYISDNTKMTDDLSLLFKKYLIESDFFRNGDVYMKQIYLSENINQNKNIIFAFYKFKYNINLHDIENYDIEKYISTYQHSQKSYEKKFKEFKGCETDE
jgi:hypothetical protein